MVFLCPLGLLQSSYSVIPGLCLAKTLQRHMPNGARSIVCHRLCHCKCCSNSLTAGAIDSDIIHVQSFRKSIIVLNSVEAAREILDKKGANFCDRPRFTLLEV